MSDIDFRGSPIADLVGQPVVAIVKANDMMARQQVKLLMQNCFSGTNNVYEPVMITMLMRRGFVETNDDASTSIRQRELRFQIPLITLLPINSLAIEDVKIEFEMDVHTHHEVIEEGYDDLFDDVSSPPITNYDMAGNISYSSQDETDKSGGRRSRGSSVFFSISAAKLPLPVGVTTMLEVYSKSIHPSDDLNK